LEISTTAHSLGTPEALVVMRCETDKRFGRFETAFQKVSPPKTFQ
jgi:hypothetical protein